MADARVTGPLWTPGVLTSVLGLGICLLAFLQMVTPILRIHPHEVQKVAPFGLTIGRYPIASLGDLLIEGNTLRHLPTGRRVLAMGFGVHRPDGDMLRAYIPSRPPR